MNPKTSCHIVFAILLFQVSGFLSAQSSQDNMAEFIIKAVEHNESLIKNFDAKYSFEFYDPKGELSLGEGHTVPGYKREYRFVREGSKFYSTFTYHEGDGAVWEGERWYDGKRTKMHRNNTKRGMILGDRKLPSSLTVDRFTNLYATTTKSMSEVLRASKFLDISQTNIDGHKCFVVRIEHCDTSEVAPVEQKITFDADRGFIPLRVEDIRTDLSKEQAMMVHEGADFVEAAPGIYFPTKGKVFLYDRNSEGNMVLEQETRLTVEDVQVNLDLPVDYFDRKFPQGYKVYDNVLDHTYTVGETLNSLQKVEEQLDETSNDAVDSTSNDDGAGVDEQGHDEKVQAQEHTSDTANQEVELGLSLTKKYMLVGLGLVMAGVVVVSGRKMCKRPRGPE